MLKIHQGTRSDGASPLCSTCRNGTFMAGAAESQEITYCSAIETQIDIKIVECSRYNDKRMPSLADMRESAFYLISKNSRIIGFVPANEFKQSNREEFYATDLKSSILKR